MIVPQRAVPAPGRRVLRIAALLALAGAAALPAQPLDPPAREFDVTHYEARIAPDLAAKSVAGTVTVTVRPLQSDARVVALDRGALEVTSVTEAAAPLPYTTDGSRLRVTLPARTGAGSRDVTIRYRGTPRFGLVFQPERRQMYTVFSTSQWMVAVDAPDDRASLALAVEVPRGWALVASGREVSRRPLSAAVDLSSWRLDREAPTYTFGFAAGVFRAADDDAAAPALRYLADGFSDADLRRVFADSRATVRFFEDRAGVPFPGDRYTQVLVAQTVGQEMAGFSIVGEADGRAVLADATAVTLLAHELAHQWWGNMVTNRAWTEFWLNEGIATFMAAAFREHRFGADAYRHDVEGMRTRYERVKAAGHDKPLVFPDWNRPSADDRTLVYQKGAYVVHLLRERLGERAFWDGLRRYTTAQFGRSVTTADFQRAMEEAAGRDLGDFFREWIGAARP